jgi:RhtB (resistance to homoserine/threonine) family protein
MSDIVGFWLFVGAVLLLNITPGPDTAYIVGRSIAQGRRAGVLSALGITLGCTVHSLACAVGLTAILAASPSAFMVIKWLGAAYLVYLGLRLMLSRVAAQADTQARPRAVLDDRQLLTQGFATNVLNPKVILFFVSFFPQFVAPESVHKSLAFLLLGLTFVVMSTAWNVFVAWIAGSVTRRFAGRDGFKRWMNRLVGAAFIALGVRLAA